MRLDLFQLGESDWPGSAGHTQCWWKRLVPGPQQVDGGPEKLGAETSTGDCAILVGDCLEPLPLGKSRLPPGILLLRSSLKDVKTLCTFTETLLQAPGDSRSYMKNVGR